MVIKKLVVFGIIILFIGIAIAPTINYTTVKASVDNDTIEVTSQACGIKGYGNTTVKLTKQQYQNLQNYLVDFRARLNQTTTRGEAVPIFKDAVVELNKYGLLPKGMSVEKTEKLVIGQNQNKNLEKIQEKLIQYHLLSLDNTSNYNCTIVWEGSPFTFYHPIWILLSPLLWVLGIFGELLGQILAQTYLFHHIRLLSSIGFGDLYTVFGEDHYEPFYGHINTVGLNGNLSWDGPLYGAIRSVVWANGGGRTEDYIGATGFSGLNIVSKQGNVIFGTALHVKITLGSFPN